MVQPEPELGLAPLGRSNPAAALQATPPRPTPAITNLKAEALPSVLRHNTAAEASAASLARIPVPRGDDEATHQHQHQQKAANAAPQHRALPCHDMSATLVGIGPSSAAMDAGYFVPSLPRLQQQQHQPQPAAAHSKVARSPSPPRQHTSPDRSRAKVPAATRSFDAIGPIGQQHMGALPPAYFRRTGVGEVLQQASDLRTGALAAPLFMPKQAGGGAEGADWSGARAVEPVGMKTLVAGAVSALAGAQELPESITGGQVELLLELPSGYQVAPVANAIQRKALMLKLPLGIECTDAVPAVLEDASGHACLVVLPSDGPSNRHEAAAVDALLGHMLHDPANAGALAIAWRADTLGTLCASSLTSLAACVKGQSKKAAAWQFRRQDRGTSGKAQSSADAGADLAPDAISRVANVLQRDAAGQQHALPLPAHAKSSGSGPLLPSPRLRSSAGGTLAADQQQQHYAEQQPVLQEANQSEQQEEGQQEQQQLQQQEQEQHPHGQPGEAGAGGQQWLAQQPLSSLDGLCMGATVCMADLVRQVEVHCGDRGRSLARVWNAFVSTVEATSVELRNEKARLEAANAALLAEMAAQQRELKGMDFLRREAMRFRKGMEEAQQACASTSGVNSNLQTRLEFAEGELARIETHVAKRLAVLRWQNARHIQGTWTQQTSIITGAAGKRGTPGVLLGKVAMLEALAKTVLQVERRRIMFGRHVDADEMAVRHGPRMADMVQTVSRARVQALSAGGAAHGADTIAMLMNLTPEARTMVLMSMPDSKRWQVLSAMRDEDRADCIIAMSADVRRQVQNALDPKLWDRTMDVIKNSSYNAARYLSGMVPDDAFDEFHTWTVYQQVDVLSSLDPSTAARLLRHCTEPMLRELLGMMQPHVVANILQAMPPPPAAAALEQVLDLDKAINILLAMDANKAADVLTELGAVKAAEKLMHMEPGDRSSIIESMNPRDAANTVLTLETSMCRLEHQQTGRSRAGPGSGCSSPVPSGDGRDGRDGRESPSFSEGGSMRSASPLQKLQTRLGGGRSSEAAPAHDGTLKSMKSAGRVSFKGGAQDASRPDFGFADGPVGPGGLHALAQMDVMAIYQIMGFMSTPEKAALLARLETAKVGELLALLDENEALTLLTLLEEHKAGAVAKVLTSQDKQKLLRVLGGTLDPAANAAASASAAKAKPKASPRRRDPDAAGMAASKASAAAASSNAASSTADVATASNNTRPTVAATAPASVGAAAGQQPAGKDKIPVESSGGDEDEDDDEEDDVSATATASKAQAGGIAAAASSNSKSGAGKRNAAGAGSKAPANAARISRASTASNDDAEDEGGDSVGEGDDDDASDTPVAAPAVKGHHDKPRAANARTSVTGATAGARNTTAPAKKKANGTKGSKSGATAAGVRRSSVVGSADGVASEDSSRHVSETGNASRAANKPAAKPRASKGGHQAARMRLSVDTEGGGVPLLGRLPEGGEDSVDGASFMSTPRPGQDETDDDVASTPRSRNDDTPAGRIAAHAKAGAGAAAALKRVQLKNALKRQLSDRSTRASIAGAIEDDDVAPSAVVESQAKLGRLPKNARLIEAMAQHKNAKPKPKGWLMAVVECIYKEGETLLRKLGRTDMIRKQSVPEIVFAYFHNKYGQRALVNENVGSLVNTLTLHKEGDLRLEAFARLLSEEWDVSIFLDFLSAQALCLQPSKAVCIEYARESTKDEQYPWVCLYKAVAVTDNLLGARSQMARERFNEFLQMASVPADDADVDKVRRERREAAKTDPSRGADDLPDSFYKLPRIRCLLILCKEINRINRYLTKVAEDKFGSLDLTHAGRLPKNVVQSFVKAVIPPTTTPQACADTTTAFLALAEGTVKDIPPEQIDVSAVQSVAKPAFVAAVLGTPMVRDYIKTVMLPPASLEDDDGEAQVFYNLLTVMTVRHHKFLGGLWDHHLKDCGDAQQLQQLSSSIKSSNTGDGKFKAYVSLLLGLINHAMQEFLETALNQQADQEQPVDAADLEERLCRLEDAALVLLQDCRYLLEDSDNLSIARMMRLPGQSHIHTIGSMLLLYRDLHASMTNSAAYVVQNTWRKRRRRLGLAF